MGRKSRGLPLLVRRRFLGLACLGGGYCLVIAYIFYRCLRWRNEATTPDGGSLAWKHAKGGEAVDPRSIAASVHGVFQGKTQDQQSATPHESLLDDNDLNDIDVDRLLIAQIHAFPVSTETRIISFGLYGNDPKYTVGAVRNAELVNVYFPGWTARYYLDGSVPIEVVRRLIELGSEVVMMNGSGTEAIAGMFWRFLVADDPSVERYIVRDTDSRLNARDRLAVEEWILSKMPVHSVRDSVWHCHPLNGGMWGGVRGAIQDMGGRIANWSSKSAYGQDMDFLNQDIWPLVQDKQLGHDAYCCEDFPNTRPFPTKRYGNYQHVGQVFNYLDEPVPSHIEDIRLKLLPDACRKHPTWVYG